MEVEKPKEKAPSLVYSINKLLKFTVFPKELAPSCGHLLFQFSLESRIVSKTCTKVNKTDSIFKNVLS